MLDLDDHLTLYLNSFHNPYWDEFFFIFTGQLMWISLALSIIYAMYQMYGKHVWIPLIAVVLIILLADQISSSVFKPLFERLRPSRDPDIGIHIHTVNGYLGGMYGFVSSHAANSVAFALFSSLLFKHRISTLIISSWAILTAYSRIYLGVHFLGDVVAGAAIGAIVALTIFFLHRYIQLKYKISTNKNIKYSIYIVLSTYLLSIISLMIYICF